MEDCQYPYLACEYAGDGCLTDGPNGWYSLQYIWNDDCECAPAEGCLDSSACNYGQSFDGFVISAFGEPFQYGGYESPPYCLSPGDSCNVFYENSVIPAPIPMNLLPPYDYFTYYGFYSGIFNSNCDAFVQILNTFTLTVMSHISMNVPSLGAPTQAPVITV